jgi:superfamily I DNA/RNA helicase
LPRKIWGVADKISSRIKHRYAKEWTSRDEEGVVKRVGEIDQVDLSSGDWMILVRNQYQLERVQEVIHQHGYPYKASGKSSLRKPYVHAIVYYERLRRGDSIEPGQLELLRKYCSKISPLLSRPRKEWPDWMTMLDGLSGREKEYIRSCLRKGESLKDEPRIKINTIHSVKGSEADNVIVFPDITVRIKQDLDRRFDEEARVWYVAASRAKQALYITETRNTNFFDI